uniref:Uncharacterized protein n=1 Tax=Avena sativa TaxID=4498 RepID=A0ACD5TAX4_AVESA
MADDGASGASGSTAGDSESTAIEINIKTLESQVHKLRVQKSETVLNLKEKIVDVAGIPVDQQRLIFRGRVLKDDHLLSEYHLEDGYTLHLVARRAAEGQPSSGTSEENTQANVNAVENGAMLGDYMSRTVRDILGSLGLGMPGGVANATFSVPLNTAPNGATTNGRTQPGNPPPPGFSILNHQIHVSQLQPGGAIPRNMVIPDSMTTLLEYMNRMDQVLQNNGVPSVDSNANAQQPPRSDDAYLNQRFPSPEVLVSVVERAQQVLGGSASSALSHLAERIQRDAATADTSTRSQIQNESAQLGVAMQHLGAMLLELGRTMMMLRMGASPANAFVNAGSAVYINPTGPNPIMVQPSYQSAPHFGVSSIPVLSGVSGPFSIVDPSRTSGGASATSAPSVGSTTASATTTGGDRQNVERTQGGNTPANSTHGLPPRTTVAAIPGILARSSGPSNVLGVILPVQRRGQVAAPNQSTVSQGSQNAVGNGSQPNSTYVVPQAAPVGAANIASIVAQITAEVANALAANPPGMVSSSTVPQGSQNAVGNGSQPNSTYVVPQAASGGAINISSIVAQISAQVANALAANPPGMVSSSVPNTAAQGPHPTANNGAGAVSSATSGNTQLQNELPVSPHGQTLPTVQSHVTGTGTLYSNTSDTNLTPQDSSTVNASRVDTSQQHSQMENTDVGNIATHSRELPAASLAGQLTDTCTGDVPLSMSAESSESKNKLSDGGTGESTKPSGSGRSGPLGLGGGLQPKRRTRVAKPSETSGDSGEALDNSSVARSQEAVLMGQQALRALVSRSTNASNGSVSNPHPASLMPQAAAAGQPPRRPGGDAQVDIGSMLSSVLNSPVFGNLMSNVAAQTGLESPADVRNIMEDLTQNPAVMDTLSSMVQSVDGPRRGQGGFDLSRMMQQMMPVVNQVLGGVAARPSGTETGDSRLQPRQNDREVSDAVDARSSQIDLHEACERIRQCDPPEDILGAVLETAAQAYGEDESIQFMLEDLANDPELADDYLKLLLEQVGERVESESETKQQS